ncbi:hypothetical protein [Devosia sp. RR2S18]|uniref:hypothetical protein n=1 Tax=Devosia rhizosphaerae TaxID=3049774 RepID=UPI00253FEF98|nr:hypothetical protein [Devosia sp. RR2S18]WIJ23846.1 hypothetical protein QOV41_12350 [Devosia sp. RR2S18]
MLELSLATDPWAILAEAGQALGGQIEEIMALSPTALESRRAARVSLAAGARLSRRLVYEQAGKIGEL